MSDPSETILSVRQIKKSYHGRLVLDNVSFDVRRGEVFVILGGSGMRGKSTMLRIMAGGVEPTSGQVFFNGQDMSAQKGEAREKIRRRFGMSFQSSALLDFLNVEENVSLPIQEHTKLDPHIISIMAQTKLGLVGLQGFDKHYPNELSGGMRKRAGLARAIAMDPEIVFYDEPTAGLDPVVCAVVDRLILDLTKKLQITSVVVTHNMESVFRIADRVAMLYQGRLLQVGTAEEIRNSSDPIVQQFIRGEIDGPIQVS